MGLSPHASATRRMVSASTPSRSTMSMAAATTSSTVTPPPLRPGGLLTVGRGGGHLPDEVEAVIRDLLRTRYLTRQKRSKAAVHRELARACRSRGWPVPSQGTLERRIARLDLAGQASAR